MISDKDRERAALIRAGKIRRPSALATSEGLFKAMYGDDDELWLSFRANLMKTKRHRTKLKKIRSATLSLPEKKTIIRLFVTMLRDPVFMATALSNADDDAVMTAASLIIK